MEMANELLSQLNVSRADADVLVAREKKPYEFTVVIYAPKEFVNPVSSFHGHPVRLIFSKSRPQPHYYS